jgi:hypothetical protein
MDEKIEEIVAKIRERDAWLAEHVAEIAKGKNIEDKALALVSAIALFTGGHDEGFLKNVLEPAHAALLTLDHEQFRRIARRFAIECSALEVRADEVFDEPEFNEVGWWTQAQFVALNYHRLMMFVGVLALHYNADDFPLTRLGEVEDMIAPGFSAALGVAAPLWEPSEALKRVNKNEPRAWWGAQGEPD